MTFDQWLKTYHGKACEAYPITGGSEYLRNRLWWAFEAGKAAQRNDAMDHSWGAPSSTPETPGEPK
jgi:hypothetical protein